MFVIVTGRRQGKSVALVRWLLEDPDRRVILVADQASRRDLLHLISRAPNVPTNLDRSYWVERIIPAEFPLSARHLGAGASEIAIDDVDRVLGNLLMGKVSIVTINGTPIGPADIKED